jgi:site-specific DNA-methyltransferase (adenine-specific)
MQTLWADIRPINSQAAERLGYPTQKPRALLERIIAASSNPGDVVLDPVLRVRDRGRRRAKARAAVDRHRRDARRDRHDRGPDAAGYPGIVFETIGVPRTRRPPRNSPPTIPHQFQQWVCWQVGGYPRDKKGGDKGVDGWFNYLGRRRAASRPA